MKFHLTPGVLAFGLATLIPAAAQKEGAAEKPAEAPATPAAPADPAKMKSDTSYFLGTQTGSQFSQMGLGEGDIDGEAFLKGLNNAVAGKKPEIPEETLKAAVQAFGEVLMGREKERASKALDTGKKFLEENGKREGVTTTKSGLQYEVLEKGGEEKYVAPKEGEPEKEFMVSYRGTLIDGTEFDASPEGQTVPMGMQVIEGFKEALTTMPVGAKWKLFIPSQMAYGDKRRSAEIGPNSVLIFELKLAEIKDAKPDPHGGLPFPMPEGAEGAEGE